MSASADGPRETESTFLVTETDDVAAVLRDVHDAEIHALEGHPDLEEGEVLAARLRAEPPMEATWSIADLEERWTVDVTTSSESPTARAREVAADQAAGEVTTRERAGEGEVHVLAVPEDRTESAAADVRDDDQTVARAARLGVRRVEIRADEGVLSVRYLP